MISTLMSVVGTILILAILALLSLVCVLYGINKVMKELDHE